MKMTIRGQGGLRQVEAVLQSAHDDAVPEGKKVVGRGALNIKNDWKARWSGLDRAGGLPRAITYDVTAKGTLIDGEIGPDLARGGQAPLGGFLELEYGTRWSAPQPAGAPALDAEAPRFERAVADLGAKLLGDA